MRLPNCSSYSLVLIHHLPFVVNALGIRSCNCYNVCWVIFTIVVTLCQQYEHVMQILQSNYGINVLIVTSIFWNKVYLNYKAFSFIDKHMCICQIKTFLACSITLLRRKCKTYGLYSFVCCCDALTMSIGCPTSTYFGETCSLSCSPHCINRRCHIETGHCFGCIAGYQGPVCEQRMYICNHTWLLEFYFLMF